MWCDLGSMVCNFRHVIRRTWVFDSLDEAKQKQQEYVDACIRSVDSNWKDCYEG